MNHRFATRGSVAPKVATEAPRESAGNRWRNPAKTTSRRVAARSSERSHTPHTPPRTADRARSENDSQQGGDHQSGPEGQSDAHKKVRARRKRGKHGAFPTRARGRVQTAAKEVTDFEGGT